MYEIYVIRCESMCTVIFILAYSKASCINISLRGILKHENSHVILGKINIYVQLDIMKAIYGRPWSLFSSILRFLVHRIYIKTICRIQ